MIDARIRFKKIRTRSIRPLTVTGTTVLRHSMNETNSKKTLRSADIPGVQITMAAIETMAGTIKIATTNGDTRTAAMTEVTHRTVDRTTTMATVIATTEAI